MTNHPQSTSSRLLDRVRAQDENAWRSLSNLYTPLIYSWCRHCRLAAEDAADVTQEVFRAVHRGIGEFERNRAGGSFRGWLWTITRNKIRDYFRKEAGRPEATGGTDAQLALQQIPDVEPPGQDENARLDPQMMQALEYVRAEFEDKTWEAFWRSVVLGEETSLIASDLGLRPSTVRTAKSRVLRRLREEFRGLD